MTQSSKTVSATEITCGKNIKSRPSSHLQKNLQKLRRERVKLRGQIIAVILLCINFLVSTSASNI